MVPPFRGNAQGNEQGNQNLTLTQGGVSQKQQGGCPIPTFHFSLSLFGVSSYDRPTRTAPAVRGKTGATPHFVPLARHGDGGVSGTVSGTVSDPLPAFGEVAPVCMYPCGKAPRPARGPDDQQRRAAPCLTDSSARSRSSAASVSGAPGCGPARFPRPIPWRCSSAPTPRTCIAPSSRRNYLAPGVAVFLAGQFLISTSRIWFARMGVRVGRRSHLPTWPLSPTADGPAIVVGEVHHPVRAIESPAPEWRTIPSGAPPRWSWK